MNHATVAGMAVVTGATGDVGASYALGLAQRGYELMLVGCSHCALQELADRVLTDTGRHAALALHDLAHPQEVAALAQRLRCNPEITLLANLAGVATFRPGASVCADKIEQTVAVNINAVTQLCRAVAPGFSERRRGVIVNFASILASRPWGECNLYDASKAYVVDLSQSLQAEFEQTGVLVQVVTPPACSTRAWQEAGFSYENLPVEAVRQIQDLVGAALAGLDKGDQWVLPSPAQQRIPDGVQSRRAMLPLAAPGDQSPRSV